MKKFLLITAFLFTVFGHVWAQQQVTGTITDENGQPLPGANILIKGSASGTVSDVEGNYTIQVPGSDSELIFSFVGYLAEQVRVGEQSLINITLYPDITQLQDIVVIGYGTQERKDLTGSISSVQEQQIKEIPTTNFQQALQGRTPGVFVNQNGGDPRGDFSIQVRGVNSLNFDSSPLFVVDGVPLFEGSLYHIDPDNIESMDVLKDASAAAIFGARAANGVVIITTKTGKPGQSTINFSADVGWQSTTNPLDLMNSEEYAQVWINARELRGQAIPPEFSDPEFFEEDNDYQDLVTRTAFWEKYTISATGGSENTTYSILGSYTNREGVIINTDFQRANLNIKVESDVKSKLKVGANMGLSGYWGNLSQNNQVAFDRENTFLEALFAKPWVPVFDENGNLTGPPRTAAGNGPFGFFTPAPIHTQLLVDREDSEFRFLGSVFAEYEIVEGLRFKSSFGVDLFNRERYRFNPSYEFGRGLFTKVQSSVSRRFDKNTNWVADQTLTYDRRFGKHGLTALAGLSIQQFENVDLRVNRRGATDNIFNQPNNNQPDLLENAGGGGPITTRLFSYFGRVIYDYDDRYLFTATVRRDGSSRFARNNRFGTFPSVSAGWKLTNESFMPDLPVVDDIKLRVSYGESGNQNFASFSDLGTIGANNVVLNNQLITAFSLQSLSNADLQWETNRQFNLGLDLGLLEGKINLTVDYFNKTNDDLLLQQPISGTAGVNEQNLLVNFGSIENRGIELGINSQVTFGEFTWNSGFTVSRYRNEVLDFGRNENGEPIPFFGATLPEINLPTNISVEGHPIGAFYGVLFDGVYQTGETINVNNPGVSAGDFRFVDSNNDGTINTDDRTFIGDPNPDFYGGWTNSLSWKGLTLTMFWTFSYGNDIYNVYKNWGLSGFPGFNSLREYNDHWTPENPTERYSRPWSPVHFSYNVTPSDRFVEDGSYLRLKNLALAYNVPKSLVDRIGVSGLRLTLTGSNLITITDYSGIDPENNSGLGFGNARSLGVDYIPYPFTRNYNVKLDLTF